MLFDDLDKKIKEAADQHHPAYDEKAWQKMDKLLNEHLPRQGDDRRRVLALLLLLLLLGGGAYFAISKPWQKKTSLTQSVVQSGTQKESLPGQKDKPSVSTAANDGALEKIAVPTASSSATSGKSEAVVHGDPQRLPADGKGERQEGIVKSKGSEQKLSILREQKGNPVVAVGHKVKNDNSGRPLSGLENGSAGEITVTTTPLQTPNKSTSEKGSQPKNNATLPADEKKKTDATLTSTEPVVENSTSQKKIAATSTEPTANNLAPQKKIASPGKRSGLGFFVTTGPDASKAGSSKTGKTTLLYGGGVSYTRNRFTLSAGVLASKKLYWASSDNYKLAFNTNPQYKFVGADADCDVIDIPLVLSYAFSVQQKSSWFAGVGLSSYLMKKEQYVYVYKTTSTTSMYPWQTKNENQHYLSILNLSAGYTRKLNNVLSISAQPYLELPLTGIGEGKVHLNSGGILFTLGIHPFKK